LVPVEVVAVDVVAVSVVVVAVVEDDVCAVAGGRVAFDCWRVGRHHDHARDVQQLPGERHRLRVIS